MKSGFCLGITLSWLAVVGCGDSSRRPASNEAENPSAQKRVQPVINNEIRNGTGLRPIEGQWFLYRSDRECDIWKNRESGFIIKAVSRDVSGNPTSEDDYYYSGMQFTDSEGTAPELLTVRYDYHSKAIGVFYRGTNIAIMALLNPILMPEHDPSTNIAQVVELVRDVTKGWPDAMKDEAALPPSP